MRGMLIALCTTLALSACSSGKTLHNTRSLTGGPDEFGVLPAHQLEIPQSLSFLPEPDAMAGNRAEPDPEAAAVAALGGRANGGVAGDAALMTAVSRYGTEAHIRETLAAEDATFRRRKGGFSLFGAAKTGRYFRAYRAMALDAYAEFQRFRAAGVTVPSAPPEH